MILLSAKACEDLLALQLTRFLCFILNLFQIVFLIASKTGICKEVDCAEVSLHVVSLIGTDDKLGEEESE